MLLIRACVCRVVCHTVHGSGGDDQFHQYDLHPELHRGTGRIAPPPSQLASIPVTFLYNIHVRADGLLLWLLSGCRRPEWRRVSLPEVFRISLFLRLNFETFQDGRCSGGGPPLHGERNGELPQRGGQGVPVPAAVPTHLLRSCAADGDVHFRPLRDGDSTSGRPQPGWIQW